MEIYQIPLLKDNYSYVLKTKDKVAVIDPSNFEGIDNFLHQKGWPLDFILNTHHHWDHTGGNANLKAKHQSQVIGPFYEKEKIPSIDQAVKDKDTLEWGGEKAEILFLPGHTKGHIAYWFAKEKALFCGDVLFSLGCGRIFEGTPQDMWKSLNRILTLPPDTTIYCAHEYTLTNSLFALDLEPDNESLIQRAKEVKELIQRKKPSVPSLLSLERQTNPFLRTESPSLRRHLKMEEASKFEIFKKIRQLRDVF